MSHNHPGGVRHPDNPENFSRKIITTDILHKRVEWTEIEKEREREREREREGESQNGPFSFVRSGSVARAALTEGPGFESSHQRFY